MFKNLLKFIVIFLAILIIICFAFLLYGLYSKISNTEIALNDQIASYSLNLSNTQSIQNVETIDENNLLITISDNDQLSLIIYNIDKYKIISKIEDPRFIYFGKRLIYQNQPEILAKNEYKEIHQDIAKKILNPEETRFTTLPMAEKLIDDIRAEKDISDEKLNYMNEIDQYLKQMRQTYETAI